MVFHRGLTSVASPVKWLFCKKEMINQLKAQCEKEILTANFVLQRVFKGSDFFQKKKEHAALSQLIIANQLDLQANAWSA